MRGATLSRADLESRRRGFLLQGGWTKADLWRSSLASGEPAVVKDFRDKRWFVRLWGRIQIAREAKILALLAASDVAPRLLGRVDSLALAMELLEGEPLYLRVPGTQHRPHLEALRAAVARFQSLGVVHNDLRGRENVILRPDGRVVVLDWAGAVHLPPGTLHGRLLFPIWKRVDDSAFLKWVDMLDPASLTGEDREFLRRFRRWRFLWPFNRKGVGWTRNN